MEVNIKNHANTIIMQLSIINDENPEMPKLVNTGPKTIEQNKDETECKFPKADVNDNSKSSSPSAIAVTYACVYVLNVCYKKIKIKIKRID